MIEHASDIEARLLRAEVVAMDEQPAAALRGKKDSSMRVAIDLVKKGDAEACVSAGNTGALMAISRFVLRTLPGIDRPAIATILPTLKGHTYVLDLGANVDCTAEHLLQFGIMGSELVASVDGKPEPTVGLLNIGQEDIKGNEVVKRAADTVSGASETRTPTSSPSGLMPAATPAARKPRGSAVGSSSPACAGCGAPRFIAKATARSSPRSRRSGSG